MAILLINKKARFDFHVLESYQAGLALESSMVKLIRGGRVTLQGVYIVRQNNRLEMIGLGNESLRQNVPLLLKQQEVNEIQGHLSTKGVTCIPLNIKTVGRWIKAEIAVVKGKKTHDKRETLKQRDLDREIRRSYKI